MQTHYSRKTHGGASFVKFVLLRSNTFVRDARKTLKKRPDIFQFVEHEGSHAILLESIGTHDEVY